MSIQAVSIMLGVFFVAAIVISFVKKVNPGIVGMVFAIIAGIITGTNWKTIQSGFPTGVVMTLFAISVFFGYFIENGTVQWLAKKLLYATRNIPKLMPFIFFFVAAILGGIGGANMVIFSCAIAFPVGVAAGMVPWEIGGICLIGTQCGSYMPWGTHGSTARAIVESMNDGHWADSAMSINWGWWGTSVIVYLIVVVAYFFIFKNYKLQKVENIEQPGPATKQQRTSLLMIAILLVLVVCVPLITKGSTNATVKTITKMCDVVPLCIIGAFVNRLLGLGDEKKVITKHVPWNVICMVFGMGMLVNLATALGVFDYLAGILEGLPAWAVAPVFLLIAGVMSLFSSSLSVVYPAVLPISGLMAINFGINPVMAIAVVVIGAATTAMSPLSSGGGQIMSAFTEDLGDQQTMFNNLFLTALLTMIILLVCAFVGIFGIFGI